MSRTVNSFPLSRRSFVGFGLASLGASLLAENINFQSASLTNQGEQPASGTEFYGLDKQLDKTASKKLYIPGIVAEAPAPIQHMLFYYDKDRLTNPFNVSPDQSFNKTKKYSFEAQIVNFHTSASNDAQLWQKLEHDLQLQLGISTKAEEDDLTWVVLSAMRVFIGGKKSGTDQRLQEFQAGVEPTKDFSGSSKIAIENGFGRFQLQVFAQKKKSIWSQLLKIGEAAANSFAFGTLPIPKLLNQGVKFTTTVLDYIQAKDRLVPILTSGQLPFRLTKEVTAADFTLKEGTWVAIDRQFAMAYVDGNTDLPGFKVSVPGQFYELTDNKNKPVSADYLVCKFRFPETKA
jgi:hypothetical protein